ncbi:hypothetical protein [Legionella sainthelensi]|uniref:hypothetical protein n=1 Tax=Legionella sainthelensi TaxID=28087 RepID=UPI000E20208A|nr:hypothetical protein [Legionella sainthelensi]
MPLQILSLRYGILPITLLFFFSLLGINLYQGSYFYYFFFDIAWLIVLLSAFCFSQSYVIFYIQLMLFLGFWAKFMGTLILGVALVEPTGYWSTEFFANAASWDRVLLVSGLAACGIWLANLFFFFITKNGSKRNQELHNPPQWYVKHSNLIWPFIFTLGVAISIINVVYRISVTGFRPQVVLPFHLNAILLWIMVIAIPLCMATFLGWEPDAKQKRRRFYWVCFLALFASLSILSRAIYFFWTLPYILILLSASDFSLKKLSLWASRKEIFIYLVCAVISLFLVNTLRINSYVIATSPTVSLEKTLNESVLLSEKFSQLKKLFVGRWVGLEAVMATTAFPESGLAFFKKGLLEKPSVGDIGIYTRGVLKPNKYHNTEKTMFSSLPGLAGILNYSHSNALVFWGMFGVCFFLCWVEKIIFLMMKNKFLLSQQGFILSYWCVSGLNIPYLGVINLFECLFVSVFLMLISFGYDWIGKYINKNPSLCSV